MVRHGFEQSLHDLREELLLLANLVDTAIARAVESLVQRNQTLARQVIADDSIINHKRFQLEERTLLLLATQQPMAGDLRLIAAGLHIVTELERIADHAAGIAKITLLIGDAPLIKPLIDVPRMAEQVRAMLQQAIAAFVGRDAEAAEHIGREDDRIDDLYNQVYHELLTYMLRDPSTIQQATYLLWVAHNLERMGDRITNICERVIFLVTGKMEEIKSKTDGLLLDQPHPQPPSNDSTTS